MPVRDPRVLQGATDRQAGAWHRAQEPRKQVPAGPRHLRAHACGPTAMQIGHETSAAQQREATAR